MAKRDNKNQIKGKSIVKEALNFLCFAVSCPNSKTEYSADEREALWLTLMPSHGRAGSPGAKCSMMSSWD